MQHFDRATPCTRPFQPVVRNHQEWRESLCRRESTHYFPCLEAFLALPCRCFLVEYSGLMRWIAIENKEAIVYCFEHRATSVPMAYHSEYRRLLAFLFVKSAHAETIIDGLIVVTVRTLLRWWIVYSITYQSLYVSRKYCQWYYELHEQKSARWNSRLNPIPLMTKSLPGCENCPVSLAGAFRDKERVLSPSMRIVLGVTSPHFPWQVGHPYRLKQFLPWECTIQLHQLQWHCWCSLLRP